MERTKGSVHAVGVRESPSTSQRSEVGTPSLERSAGLVPLLVLRAQVPPLRSGALISVPGPHRGLACVLHPLGCSRTAPAGPRP